ncbi:MAG TPA: acyl-CoA dehydrogenase family protein [Sporolactobacillaceae bacterium]|nr:acyl-CoA dehydrogenase family protein [Sporolactobacillaceae bacterium]
MISFYATDDEQAFIEIAKSFAMDRVRPEARVCEQNRSVSADILKKVDELGFNVLELPESWGGLELPLISQVQILQALSYGDIGVVQGLTGAGDTASLIRLIPEHSALQSYKREGLGRHSWPSAAFLDHTDTEDPWTAKLEMIPNDSGYLLNGISKPARLATTAEYVAVAGKDTQGESVILWLDNQKWQVEEGDYRLGLLACGLGRLHFSQLSVSHDQVIARGAEAESLIARLQNRILVLQGSKEVGLMDAALEYATEYTAGRKAFGQEIAKFQGVSFTIADMAFERQASRNLVYQAATKVDDEKEDASGYVLRAIYRTHRSVRFVTDSAVQLLGGHGFVQEFPVEKWMRDAEAQVMLYGREKALLLRRGQQIMNVDARSGVAK